MAANPTRGPVRATGAPLMERRTYYPSTARQRLFCRSLMYRAELPTHQVTVMHRDLFRKAGIDWRDGQDMDALLASLDMKRIELLIKAVRTYVGNDEEEAD